MTDIKESSVESAALFWLESFGWVVVYGSGIAQCIMC